MMEIKYSPFSIEDNKDPHKALSEMRSKCPVHQIQDGFWYISKHEDLTEAFTNYKSFSSKAGFAIKTTDLPIEDDEQTINQLDPPEHRKLRRMLMASLNAKSYRQAKGFIQQTVDDFIDQFASRGTAELISELCTPLPSTVFAHVLGVPTEDQWKFTKWTEDILEIASKNGVSPTEIYTRKENIPEPVTNIT